MNARWRRWRVGLGLNVQTTDNARPMTSSSAAGWPGRGLAARVGPGVVARQRPRIVTKPLGYLRDAYPESVTS